MVQDEGLRVYQHEVVFIVYVYNGVFASPSGAAINQAIMEIGLNFDVEYQGTLDDYIRVNIKSLPDRKINISQPHLI